MSNPNPDWGFFMLIGVFLGGIVGGGFEMIFSYDSGFVAGEKRGQCAEACLPDRLVALPLEDGACRCEHDRIIRAKSKPLKGTQ